MLKGRECQAPVYANAGCGSISAPRIGLGLDSGSHVRRAEDMPFVLALLPKHPSAHLEDSLEALSACFGVLAESLHASVLDFVLDFLPPTAERGDLRLLVEVGSGI